MAAILFDQEADWYFHSKSKQLMEETTARGFEMKPKRQLQLLCIIFFGDYQTKFIAQLSPKKLYRCGADSVWQSIKQLITSKRI